MKILWIDICAIQINKIIIIIVIGLGLGLETAPYAKFYSLFLFENDLSEIEALYFFASFNLKIQ